MTEKHTYNTRLRLKKFLRSAAAAIIMLSMILSNAASVFAAEGDETESSENVISAEFALGGVYYKSLSAVSPGLTISEVYSSSENYGRQKSFIFEYKPGGGTVPVVVSSEPVYGRSTLSTISDFMTETANVVGGVNGDFFGMATGIPMGLMINGGKLYTSSDGRAALGFFADGSAIIGNPDVTVSFDVDGKVYPVAHFNKYPSKYGAYLLNEDFGETTHSAESSTEFVFELVSDEYSKGFVVNSFVRAVLREIRKESMNSEIPANHIVLCVSDNYENAGSYSSLKIGDAAAICFNGDTRWTDVVCAVGGEDIIVKNGVTADDIVNESHEQYANPRLAAGIKADGSVVFFAIDGRQTDYSRGVKLLEVAAIMADLGCVTAINLDGGGSLTVAAKYHGDDKARVINSPSDGFQRKVANAVLFVNKMEKTDIPGSLHITPDSAMVLSGSKLDLKVTPLDTAFFAMEDAVVTNDSYVFESSEGKVSFADGKAVITSETEGLLSGASGKITVTGTVDGREVSGTTLITVTKKLDSLSATPAQMSIRPGTSAQIELQALFNDIPVFVSYDVLTCSFAQGFAAKKTDDNAEEGRTIASGKLGYLTSDGVFHTYDDAEGEDTIIISYGELSCEVKITISKFADTVLHDFNSGDSAIAAFELFTSSNAELALSLTPSGKNNTPALAFKYSFPDLSDTDMSEYGLSEMLIDGAGEMRRFVSLRYPAPVSIPAGAQYVDIWVKNQTEGKSYITVANGGIEYDIPLDVHKDYTNFNGWRLMRASLGEEKTSSLTLISPYKLVYNNANKAASGTIILDNIKISGERSPYIFADSVDVKTGSEMWATHLIEDMYHMEIAEGSISDDGKRLYHPSNDLTRQEFAKMLVSYTRIDMSKYASADLAFTDSADIAEWASPYVRAVVGAGYMKGKDDGTGVISFDPNAKITRQEVMQVFGNLLREKGKDVAADAELTFADSDKVASWAYDNVQLTVSSSVIGGYEDNTLRPLNYVTRAEIAAIFIRAVHS